MRWQPPARSPFRSEEPMQRPPSATGSMPASATRCGSNFQVSCSDCRLARICLPIALEAGAVEQLDAIVQRGRTLHKGEFAFQQDEPFTALYAVRSGALKSYCIGADGAEQITGFYFPGEIL